MTIIRSFDLIIFDFDGVLITGSNEGYFRCFHQALTGVNVHLSAEEERKLLRDYWGLPYRFQLSQALSDRPGLLDRAGELYETYLHSPAFLNQLKPADGFPEALLGLHAQNYKLAIASGMEANILKSILTQYRVIDLFGMIISGYEISEMEHQKPAPYMLNQIMQTLAVTPDRTVYVGDDASDYLMAQRAGASFIAVLTGNLTLKQANQLGIKRISRSVRHLTQILDPIKGEHGHIQ